MGDQSFWLGVGVGCGSTIALSLLLGLAIAAWSQRYLHDFLMPHQPLATKVLILEGWVPDRVIPQVAEIIQTGNYETVLISGLPLHQGAFLTAYRTHGEVAADSLVKLGIDRDRLTVINCAHTNHYRTQAAAQGIRTWLDQQAQPIAAVNLCAVGAHARRSWLIYRRVFAPARSVGSIPLVDPLYDPGTWWQSSPGFRSVLGETIAYAYVRWRGAGG